MCNFVAMADNQRVTKPSKIHVFQPQIPISVVFRRLLPWVSPTEFSAFPAVHTFLLSVCKAHFSEEKDGYVQISTSSGLECHGFYINLWTQTERHEITDHTHFSAVYYFIWSSGV